MGSSPQPPDPRSPHDRPHGTPDGEDPTAGPADPADGRVDDAVPPGDYVDGVPTFDFVRDRIEGRYATAVGSTELADESAAGRSVAQQEEDRDAAA